MITGNEPISPIIVSVENNSGDQWLDAKYEGLTIRQYFAIEAMKGMLSSPLIEDFYNKKFIERDLYQVSIAHADALILELNKDIEP